MQGQATTTEQICHCKTMTAGITEWNNSIDARQSLLEQLCKWKTVAAGTIPA